MNILITGINSSLGIRVAEIAKGKGYRVVGSVRSARLPFESIYLDNLIALDLDIPNSFLNITEQFDSIIHIAAQSYGDPKKIMLSTGLGAFYLLERAKILGIKSILHVSAVSVYGRNPIKQVNYNTTIRHSSPYGAAKWAAECYLSEPECGVNCASIRCPAILEKNYSPHLLGRIRDQMLEKNRITLSNPHFGFNNFVTLDSLSHFLVNLVGNIPEGFSAFPLACKDSLSFLEVVQMLAKEFNYSGIIDWVDNCILPFSIDCDFAVNYGFEAHSVVDGLNWWFEKLSASPQSNNNLI